MSTEANEQNLPAGIQERAAQAGQPTNIPSQEVPQYQQAPAQQQAPATPEPYQSPMLSDQSRQQAPVPPTGHLEKPQEPTGQAESEDAGLEFSQESMQDLVGDLTNDSYAQPGIAYIENACEKAGVDLDRAFQVAVERGDTDLIDSAYLREKLGKDADAVIRQATALFDYSANKAAESMNAVFEAVGGEQNLRQAVPYFNQSADAAERAEVKYLLDSGNKELMARAARRIVEHAKNAGMQYSQGNQPLGSPSTAKGLSRAEYIEAISQKNITQEQYETLREQRKLGAQQGI